MTLTLTLTLTLTITTRPLINLGPAINSLAVTPYTSLVNSTAWLYPVGDRYYHEGGIVKQESPCGWPTLFEAMQAVRGSARLSVELSSMTGAVEDVDTDAMAYPHRAGGTRIRVTSHWTDGADDAESIESVQALTSELKCQGLLKSGSHFCDFVEQFDETAAWGADHAGKLAQVRAEFDPAMVLVVNHP